MYVTLVAETRRFGQGLRRARTDLQRFATFAKSAALAVGGAFLYMAGSLVRALPEFVKAAEESRKADAALKSVADSMGLFGDNTTVVTDRLAAFANKLQFSTGVEDEVIKANQTILLTFKQLAKSADVAGGAFDRATVLTLDLAAVMKTDSASAAKQLGKVLQDPVKQLGALTKAGITFTDEEKKKIRALVESGKLLEAQDLILSAIETQVGGTAEATATSTDKMKVAFAELQERIGQPLLDAVDVIADKFAAWLESPEGKKALDDFVKRFEDFGKWIQSSEGQAAVDKLVKSFEVMLEVTGGIVDALAWITKWLSGSSPQQLKDSAAFWSTVGGAQDPRDYYVPYSPSPAPITPRPAPAPVINFNTPIDPVSAGREVARVLSDYSRAGGRLAWQ
jgi:hypothetical protein